MSSLIKRLRRAAYVMFMDGYYSKDLAQEAISEIERLRSEVKALSAPRIPDVHVKPMAWDKANSGKPEASTVVGIYRIVQAWSGGWAVTIKNDMLRDTDGRMNFATLDTAKAAAQADYERRILSAIASDGAVSR